MKIAFVLLVVVAVASAQHVGRNGPLGRRFRNPGRDYYGEGSDLDSRRNGFRDQEFNRRGDIDYTNDRNGDSRGFRQRPGSQDEYENAATGFGGFSPSRLHSAIDRYGGPIIRDHFRRGPLGGRFGSDNRRSDRRQQGGVDSQDYRGEGRQQEGVDSRGNRGEGRGNRRQQEGTDSVNRGAASQNTSGEQVTGPQDNVNERGTASQGSIEQGTTSQGNGNTQRTGSQGNDDSQGTGSQGTTSGEGSTGTNGNGSEGSN